MKTCSRCKETKDRSDFFKNKAKKDGLSYYCKVCSKDYGNEYYKISEKRRISVRKSALKRVGKLRDVVLDFLKNHPCVDCGESDIVVLEFDHVKGKKLANVSQMWRDNWSESLLLEEIAKCEVRCANCHRRRHANNK